MSVLVDAGRRGCEPAETKKTTHKPWEIEDGLWARIEPLLPVVPRNHRRPGRKRLDNRKVLCGILFVLYTGIRWEFLPQELGFGSGMTCWRRLRDWNEAGFWQKLHELLLVDLRAADLLDFSRAAIDSSHMRAMKGGSATGPSPVDRARPAASTTSSSRPTASHCHDHHRRQPQRRHPAAPADPGHTADPRQARPTAPPSDRVYGDRGYDHDKYRDQVRALQITPVIARRGTEHGSGLGVYRWVVEGTIALLHWFRRLRIRWQRRDDIHQAFITLGCAIICWRRLKDALRCRSRAG